MNSVSKITVWSQLKNIVNEGINGIWQWIKKIQKKLDGFGVLPKISGSEFGGGGQIFDSLKYLAKIIFFLPSFSAIFFIIK